MHSKGNYKQGEKTTLRMGENDSKWNNWQRINFQNIQAAHTTQYQKNKQPNQKVGKRLKHISPKKTYRWLTNTWKGTQHRSLLKRCKSKLQRDITWHWSERPSSKNLQAINAGKDMEKRESSFTIDANVNWYSHFERKTLWRFLKKLCGKNHHMTQQSHS